MFEFILGYEQLRFRFETGNDGGRDGGSDGGPADRRVGILFVVSSGFDNDGQCVDHLGEAESLAQEFGDEVGERIYRHLNNSIN